MLLLPLTGHFSVTKCKKKKHIILKHFSDECGLKRKLHQCTKILMTTTTEKVSQIMKIPDRHFFQSEKIIVGDLARKDDKSYEVQKLTYYYKQR